jgi:hypothetical protein
MLSLPQYEKDLYTDEDAMLKNEMIYRTTNASRLLGSNINKIHALAGIKADKDK